MLLQVFDTFLDALEGGEDVGVGQEFGDEPSKVLGSDVLVFYDEYVFHF